jgi:intracellular sulfur oxidation DsrE/DsrF family protein
MITKHLAMLLAASFLMICQPAFAEATYEETPYKDEQKVVFDFFLDDPAKTSSALFWLRSYMNPLMDAPYGYPPELMDIKVIIHGTEIVTVAKKNYEKYRNIVERMKYYEALGVEFRVCELAADDYGYTAKDFHDFIVMAPSAIVELGHWQQEGYALIRPIVYTRSRSIEEIR